MKNPFYKRKKFAIFIILLIKYNFFVGPSKTYVTTFVDPAEVLLTTHCEKHVISNEVLNFGKCVKYCNNDINCVVVRYSDTGCYAYRYLFVGNDVLTKSLFLKDIEKVMSAEDCAKQSAVNNLGNYSLLTITVCFSSKFFRFF